MIPVPSEQLVSLKIWAFDKATAEGVDRPEQRADDIVAWVLSWHKSIKSLTPVVESSGPAPEEDLVPVQ